jgi:hypothetical protein
MSNLHFEAYILFVVSLLVLISLFGTIFSIYRYIPIFSSTQTPVLPINAELLFQVFRKMLGLLEKSGFSSCRQKNHLQAGIS